MPDTCRFYDALRPRKLLQGGERVNMLCKGCESLLSLLEKNFQQLFFPIGGIASLPLTYDASLYRCFCSISWRVLTYLKMSVPDKYIESTRIVQMLQGQVALEDHELCEAARSRWARAVLVGEIGRLDQSVIFLNGKNFPFERSDAIGFCVFRDNGNLAVVAMLGPMILLGFIRQGPGWENANVDPAGGVFPIGSQSIPVGFSRWLHDLYFNLERVAH